MRNFKKLLLIGTITIATLITMSATSKATTIEISEDTVNLRRGASTGAKILTSLSKGTECEYLGEEGSWYKIKYKTYTGYVSKKYAKLVEDVPNTDKDNQEDNNTDDNKDSQTSETIDKNDDNEINKQEDDKKTDNVQAENKDNTQEVQEEIKLVYKKFDKNTNIKILPLIHSANIGDTKKNDEVLILAEVSGWSYIQTDEISGWVRTDTLGEARTEIVGGENKEEPKEEEIEKVGYINESYVNMRKGPGTSYSVIKSLKLNTQVTILEESGKWYKIKSGNDTGYVSKEYVSDSKKVTDRSLAEPRTEKEAKKETTTTISSDKTTTTKVSNTTTTNNKNVTNTNDKTTDKNSNIATSKDKIKDTDVIAYAKKFLGHKYVWAGDGSNGTFDCSGFTMYVYRHFGVSLPHYTVSQYNSSKGKKITKQSDLKMGDIVFLTVYETGKPYGHCGIYISNGNFIHADSSVGYVNISDLNGIYKGRFCGALRINGVDN